MKISSQKKSTKVIFKLYPKFIALAEIFENQEDYQNALNYYKKLYNTCKDNIPPLIKIAKCYNKLGEFAKAK